MLRIAELESIPVNSVIVCASCERSVYVVVRSPDNREKIIRSIHRSFGISTSYHSAWCSECKCEVQLNLKFLYISPVILEDMVRGRPTLGRSIMMFERDCEEAQC